LSALLGLLNQAQYGNTQEPFEIGGQQYGPGDVQMGMAPMDPGGVGAAKGMFQRLRGLLGGGGDDAVRMYQGTQPIAGSQGIPHASPLPNPSSVDDLPYALGRGDAGLAGSRGQFPPNYPPRPPSGGPSGSGMFADDAAGMIRGDVAPPPRPGADFSAMDDLGQLVEQPRISEMGNPIDRYASQAMGGGMQRSPEAIQMVLDEMQQINSMGQLPYEDTVGYLIQKYGDWILDFI
jgi:hypothetical protein